MRLLRLLGGLLRLCLFLLLLGFAIKNTEVVALRFYFDTVWQMPLVLVLLAAFVTGALLGVLAALQLWFRQRRELLALRRELAATIPTAPAPATGEVASSFLPISSPSTIPPAGHA